MTNDHKLVTCKGPLVNPRITPAALRRLRAALRRDWLVVRSIQREAWPIIDAWAARENRRAK